jgi:hypothetical protein
MTSPPRPPVPGHASTRARGLPGVYVNVQLVINAVARLGLAARVNDTVSRLLQRPPTTLQSYVTDHRDLWRRES